MSNESINTLSEPQRFESARKLHVRRILFFFLTDDAVSSLHIPFLEFDNPLIPFPSHLVADDALWVLWKHVPEPLGGTVVGESDVHVTSVGQQGDAVEQQVHARAQTNQHGVLKKKRETRGETKRSKRKSEWWESGHTNRLSGSMNGVGNSA